MDKVDKILAIDDDGVLLNLLQQSLGKAGYEVVTASNGQTGLKMIRSSVLSCEGP